MTQNMAHSNYTSDLPTEILELIINQLASDGKSKTSVEALASCRLASYVLCLLATPPFFSSIRLSDVDDQNLDDFKFTLLVERATKLNEILSVHNIAASVRTLTLQCHDSETLENSVSTTLMSTILHRLPHIRNFILDTYIGCKFSTIPEHFKSAIQAMCRSPNLSTLYLQGIKDFPFTALTAGPNLRCLHLLPSIDVRFGDEINLRDEPLSPQPLYLDSLAIDRDGLRPLGSRIREDLTFAKRFSRITNLELWTYPSDTDTPIIFTYGWDVMLLTSQTLTVLCLWMDGLAGILDNVPFDLGRFPALRHFKIRLGNQGDPTSLTQLLSPSSSNTGIEILDIAITWYNIREGTGKDLFSSEPA